MGFRSLSIWYLEILLKTSNIYIYFHLTNIASFFVVDIHWEHWIIYIYIYMHTVLLSLLKWTLMLSIFPLWIYPKTIVKIYPKFFKTKSNLYVYARNHTHKEEKKVPCLYVIHYGFWMLQLFWTSSNLVSCALSVEKSKSYEERKRKIYFKNT